MTASRKDTSRSSFPDVRSDLAKVDAYENTAADYDEIPDMADRDPAEGIRHSAGVPRIGRPTHGTSPKQQVTLRLDPETLERFKASGPGWQVKMGRLLKQNEVVLKMIRENIDLIDGMESMLGFMRKGELRMVFEPIEKTIATVEQNVVNVKVTTNELREALTMD